MRPRAPFIWTSKQPIHRAGLLLAFQSTAPRDTGKNRWLFFRRVVRLPAAPEAASVSITVDGRYQLFVNGAFVGRGPARSSPLFQRFDTYDVAAHLRADENVVGVLVHVYGDDCSWYERVRGLWQPAFGDGALWVEGFAQCGGARVAIESDLSWRCLESDAWVRDVPRTNHSLGFIEWLDARRLPVGWLEPGFDDGGWDAVHALKAGGGPPDSFFGGIATTPFPYLEPRGIPFLEETLVRPSRVIWAKRVAVTLAAVERQVYDEAFLGVGDVPGLAGLVASQDVLIRTGEGEGVSLLLDFERIVTGHPRIEIVAEGGEEIDIAVAERIDGEFTPAGVSADARIRPRPTPLGLDAHVCRYVARPGHQVFERFEWTAVKWMQITVRHAPKGLKLRFAGVTFARYPVAERGRFASSDAMLDRLWRTGAYTLRLCMHDGWEDCPSREQRQWLGDATVENLAGHAAFGPDVSTLNAKYLRDAAWSQRPDGLTQMFAPGDHKTDGLLIPDWTLQWVLNAADHWLYTGDLQTIEEVFPSIEKALGWFLRLRGENGLVADLPYWHFMDWAAVGRAGEACALNAQLVGACRAAAVLARALESSRAVARYERVACEIASALRQRHWDERRGVFVDCVDPETGAQDLRVSQHGNAAMLLWGEVDDIRAARIVARITDEARLKFTAAPPIQPHGEAFEPETDVVLANTFYSHFVYRALAERGELVAMLKLMRSRYGPMLAAGATTLWEGFSPAASLCHGFSATPVFQLSSYVLGVMPAAPGYRAVRFRPSLGDLDHAEGVVPTSLGDVDVKLSRTDEGFDAAIKQPAGQSLSVEAPRGFEAVTLGGGRFRFRRNP